MKVNSGVSDVTLVGRVIKCESHRYLVDFDVLSSYCKARKKIKSNLKLNEIMVGDFVLAIKDGEEYIIDSVEKRKNMLVRPYLANIDQVIITVAPVPQIDYMLLDKLIINCHKQNLDIILCLNKSDIASKECFDEIKLQYGAVVHEIISVSAANADIKSLLPLLSGKLTCFAGQSAVGKSSIINVLLDSNTQLIGGVSEKNLKGKNTTTSAQIFKLKLNLVKGVQECDNFAFIVDTPGFTMLDIHEIVYNELDLYYPEYVELSPKCKYHRCTHTSEPFCEVKKAVELGLISKSRYDRYTIMFNELKEVKKYERKEY